MQGGQAACPPANGHCNSPDSGSRCAVRQLLQRRLYWQVQSLKQASLCYRMSGQEWQSSWADLLEGWFNNTGMMRWVKRWPSSPSAAMWGSQTGALQQLRTRSRPCRSACPQRSLLHAPTLHPPVSALPGCWPVMVLPLFNSSSYWTFCSSHGATAACMHDSSLVL